MPNRFSDITRRMQAKLPYWFKKMREDDESIGAQFLNIFGLAIEDVTYMMDYAYAQCNINKIDVNQIEKVYRAILPLSIDDTYDYTITGDSNILVRVDTLEEFLASLDGSDNNELHYPNPFLISYKDHEIFVRYPYGADNENKYGTITVVVRKDNVVTYTSTLVLSVHPVWNFFDEFGLLLGTTRLPDENNVSYKERLLDVFIHPTGASAMRMINGIGRELNLRRNYTWADGSMNYIIDESMVIVNSIEIDGLPAAENIIYKDNITGKIVLLGNDLYEHKKRKISFVHGFAIRELHNKQDIVLQNQIDGIDNRMLKYIVDTINTKAPVLWGHFVWDEAFWSDCFFNDVTTTMDQSMESSLPMRLDALYL